MAPLRKENVYSCIYLKTAYVIRGLTITYQYSVQGTIYYNRNHYDDGDHQESYERSKHHGPF